MGFPQKATEHTRMILMKVNSSQSN